MNKHIGINPKLVDVTVENLSAIFRKGVSISKLNTLVSSLIALLIAKNHDYADAWQRYGIFTPLIRLNDKLLRIENLSSGEAAMVAAEGIEDTLRDIMGYSALALLWLEHNNDQNQIDIWKQMGLFDEIENYRMETAKAFGIPKEDLVVDVDGTTTVDIDKGAEEGDKSVTTIFTTDAEGRFIPLANIDKLEGYIGKCTHPLLVFGENGSIACLFCDETIAYL